ncbi:MAG: single-stranded DNA-binding protein [Mucilaginibacter sp.]|nr:single-stranded DNA-binding protein [Mucilaginibacter sp.]
MRNHSGVNKIILVGQIATEPSLHIEKIKEYHFSLLTMEIHDNQGVQVEHLEYHRIILPVYNVPQGVNLQKGLLVYLEGKIHTFAWTDEQNIKRYDTKILGTQINCLLDTKNSL